MSETCCTWLTENTGCKNSPSRHHHTTLLGYIFTTKACIDNRKKLLNSNVSPTCPYNMVNFGLLAAEIISLVWGTPANFSGFQVLAALLHGTVGVGISETLWHWTEGATYIWQGGHHVGHSSDWIILQSVLGVDGLLQVDHTSQRSNGKFWDMGLTESWNLTCTFWSCEKSRSY